MTEIIELDPLYSTTRNVRKVDAGIVDAECKSFSKQSDKFETLVFLPKGIGRKGEGGLRTRGYFKQSRDKKPLISVITVVFNGEAYLEETILSVINQDYDNVEYIIIDGGSTDGTPDIIQKYQEAIDYWVIENDAGIYDAMNKGIVCALGDIVGFLNSDDILLPDCCATIAMKMGGISKSSYTCSGVELICKEGNLYGVSIPLPELMRQSRRYLEIPCPHLGMFLHTNLYKKLGLFDTSFRLRADYDFVLRLMDNKVPCVRINRPVGKVRAGGASGGIDTYVEGFFVQRKHKAPIFISVYAVARSLIKNSLAKVLPRAFVKILKKNCVSKNKYN